MTDITITPREAGKILGRSASTIEAWLRSGTCPFGDAFKNEQSGRWCYIIIRRKLKEYLEE